MPRLKTWVTEVVDDTTLQLKIDKLAVGTTQTPTTTCSLDVSGNAKIDKLGIGKTPSFPLDISGNAVISKNIHIGDSSLISTQSKLTIRGENSSSSSQIYCDGTTEGMYLKTTSNTSGYGLRILNNDGNGLCVTNKSCVGIGVNSPEHKLHVSGDMGDSVSQVNFTGSTYGLNIKTNNATANKYSLCVLNGDDQVGLRVDNDSNVYLGSKTSNHSNDINYTKLNIFGELSVIGKDYASNGYPNGMGNIYFDCYNGTTTQINGLIWKPIYNGYSKKSAGIFFAPEEGHFRGGLAFYTNNATNATDDHTERVRISKEGFVGIATGSPGYPLDIRNGSTIRLLDIQNTSALPGGHKTDGWAHNVWSTTSGGSDVYSSMSAYFRYDIRVGGNGIIVDSDSRIKENIVEVPDNLALEQLRAIDCKYYEYKDKITRKTGKTIGFIAQQVKEQMPMAVSVVKDIIPNEMRIITDPSWIVVVDASATKFKLTIPDLEDVSSNTIYRFYVTNDTNGRTEQKEIATLNNEPKSFLFDQSWNNVFLYGKEVNDYHILDKSKLFTLNFSATQELDRIQQIEKIKLSTAETKIATLENEVAVLKELVNKITQTA